jgi:hypothetical protein
VNTQGLFSTKGQTDRMNELRAQFDAGKDVDLSKAPPLPLPLLLRLSSVMCSSLLYLHLY